MKTYRVYQVDSFTKHKFHGNPAGVVANAEGLSETQMLQIACELNNSETAFIFPSKSPDYDVEVRFFTARSEVPICGHATIAAHYIYAQERNAPSGRIWQKTKAGILPVDILRREEDYLITMTQGTPEVADPLNAEICREIIEALNITEDEIRHDCPIAVASTGHSKIMVPIISNDTLHRLQPDMQKLADLSRQIGSNGYYVFTLNPQEAILVRGRMFAPISGINEDPVTGNANGALGAYLVHFNQFQEEDSSYFEFDICQGEAIGRAGTMHVRVEKQNRKPVSVQITGEAVIAFETEIVI